MASSGAGRRRTSRTAPITARPRRISCSVAKIAGGLYGEAPRLSRDGSGNLPFAVDFRSLMQRCSNAGGTCRRRLFLTASDPCR